MSPSALPLYLALGMVTIAFSQFSRNKTENQSSHSTEDRRLIPHLTMQHQSERSRLTYGHWGQTLSHVDVPSCSASPPTPHQQEFLKNETYLDRGFTRSLRLYDQGPSTKPFSRPSYLSSILDKQTICNALANTQQLPAQWIWRKNRHDTGHRYKLYYMEIFRVKLQGSISFADKHSVLPAITL